MQKYHFSPPVIAGSIRNPWLQLHGCRVKPGMTVGYWQFPSPLAQAGGDVIAWMYVARIGQNYAAIAASQADSAAALHEWQTPRPLDPSAVAGKDDDIAMRAVSLARHPIVQDA